MKISRFVLLVILFLFVTSCEYTYHEPVITHIEISKIPDKTSYFMNENIQLDGLIVKAVYDDNSSQIIDDYSIIYPELNFGTNVFVVEYKGFETNFKINIKEYVKNEILNVKDYSNGSIKSIKFTDYDQRFINVKYGVRRAKDMMIVYDENKYIETNIHGYEASIDEYGNVVEVGTKVKLLENGLILSGHGISATLLKTIAVGDVCIYIDENIYVYQNRNIDEISKVYLKIIDVSNEIKLIEDVNLYNDYVNYLNSIICEFNEITDSTHPLLENLYVGLCNISESLDISLYDNSHNYNYLELSFDMLDTAYEDTKNYINFISYTQELYYGGFRNQDTIVYYDAEKYRERNPYGYEIAVDKNNIIIDKKILVDLTDGGYILSGHGTGAEFIKDNLNIGNKVEITSSGVNFYKDLGANEYNKLIWQRNELVSLLNEHIENGIPHDYEYINKVLNYVDNILGISDLTIVDCYEVNNIAKFIRKVEECYAIVYSQLIDHKVLETRGMWYYPFTYPAAYDDTTLDGVINTLDKFKEMGFNEIVIIPFSGKYCLYESDYFHYYEKLRDYSYGEYGNDYLNCFITEAHKRGITVNAFTQTFRCYEEGSIVFDESHYQLQYDGTYSKGQIYYYDICNDYVQDNLVEWYKELVTLYDFDKVEYDIIRYSVSNLSRFKDIEEIPVTATINDPGYTEYSMNKFMKMYNLEGNLKDLIRESLDVRNKWMEFKENELVNFISKATHAMKEIRPDLLISAAVLNDYENTKTNYLQDAKKWLDMGIVDMIEPMVYSDDYLFVVNKIDFYNDEFKNYDVRIGLSYGLNVNELMMQLEVSSGNGYILFHTRDYLQDSYYKLLKNSYHFEYVSEISLDDDKKEAVINDLIDKIENYYSVKNSENYTSLINYLKIFDYEYIIRELDTINDNCMKKYIFNIVNELNDFLKNKLF